MRTTLGQIICLIFTKEILAIWWLLPGKQFNRITSQAKRWSVSSDINSGISQSPIDISDYTDVYCPTVSYTLNYDNNSLAIFENTGYTVRVTVEGERPTLSGGPLAGQYVLQEVHFHWGTNDNEGSEHTKNGIRYPMETHVVHYNSKYGSFREALKYKDGLGIIGIVFDIVPYRNSNFRAYNNTLMTPLTNLLSDIPSQNNTVEFNADELLKWLWPFVAKDRYFTYSGSLTTSPYSEVATWLVYDHVIPISEEQITAFRQRNPEGNYRQVQPLNGRIVYFCDIRSTGVPEF